LWIDLVEVRGRNQGVDLQFMLFPHRQRRWCSKPSAAPDRSGVLSSAVDELIGYAPNLLHCIGSRLFARCMKWLNSRLLPGP
jgi:hypothetical protein